MKERGWMERAHFRRARITRRKRLEHWCDNHVCLRWNEPNYQEWIYGVGDASWHRKNEGRRPQRRGYSWNRTSDYYYRPHYKKADRFERRCSELTYLHPTYHD